MIVFRIRHRALNTHNTYSTVNCKPFLKDGWWKEICYFYLIFSWDYFISLKMTFLFWERHIFLIIFSLSPPAPPRFTSFYYLPNFVGYFLSIGINLRCPNILGCVAFHLGVADLTEPIFLEKIFSPSPSSCHLTAAGDTSCPHSLSMLT